MKQEQREKIKSRTDEILKKIYIKKTEILNSNKNNPKLAEKMVEKYMTTLEYTEARKEIIEINLSFIKSRVVDIIGTYDEKYISYGVDGMAKAIDDFDYSRGTTLLTYATMRIDRFIMNGIKEEINNNGVPYNKVDAVKKAISKLGDESPEMLSNETGIDKEEIIMILETFKTPVSLNFTPQDSHHELYETVPNKSDSIEKIVEQRSLKKTIEELLKKALTEQEYKIIKLRYGFEGEILTYEKIGKIIGISRQGVMEKEKKAIKKIKRYTRIMGLDDYREESEKSEEKRTLL